MTLFKNNDKRRSAAAQFLAAALQIALFAFALCLTASLYWVRGTFGPVSVNQILFHLTVPLASAADPQLVRSYMNCVYFAAAGTVCFALLRFFCRRRKSRLHLWCLAVALVFTGGYLEKKYCFSGFLAGRFQKTAIFDSVPSRGAVQVDFPEKKKNLIVIHLESIENAYNDASIFGTPLMPELKKLQDENLSFQKFYQVPGTGWTIGGLTSAYFGIPLFLPIDGNSYSNFKTFLPLAPSILETLETNGYNLLFFSGADFSFSGKRQLIATHAPRTLVRDLKWYQKQDSEIEKSYGSGWGVKDAYLYAQMKKELTLRSKFSKPFAFFFETVDTHGPDGYLAPQSKKVYGDFRDAIAAADSMAGDFIAWLRAQPFYENTIVVILGDHLWMGDSVAGFPLGSYTDRSVYNVFLNAPKLSEDSVNRLFCTCDWAPSILEALGANLPEHRFGIGTSLFSAQSTLLEQMGFDAFTKELGKRSIRYEEFFRGNGTAAEPPRQEVNVNCFSEERRPQITLAEKAPLLFRRGKPGNFQCVLINDTDSALSSSAANPVFVKTCVLDAARTPIPDLTKNIPLPRVIQSGDGEFIDCSLTFPDAAGAYTVQVGIAGEGGTWLDEKNLCSVPVKLFSGWPLAADVHKPQSSAGFEEDEDNLLRAGVKCAALHDDFDVYYSANALFFRALKNSHFPEKLFVRSLPAEREDAFSNEFNFTSRELIRYRGQESRWACLPLDNVNSLGSFEAGYRTDDGTEVVRRFNLSPLSFETNFERYLQRLKNPRYVTFISVLDEGSGRLTERHKRLFNDLGLEMPLLGKWRWSYLAALNGSKAVTEQVSNAELTYNGVIEGLNVHIQSAGLECGKKSSIRLNGQEYTSYGRGLNFAVYDKELKLVVDCVAFDTCGTLKASRRQLNQSSSALKDVPFASFSGGAELFYRDGAFEFFVPWDEVEKMRFSCSFNVQSSQAAPAASEKRFSIAELRVTPTFSGLRGTLPVPLNAAGAMVKLFVEDGAPQAQYVDLSPLDAETSFSRYLSKLGNSDYLVMIAAMDDASNGLKESDFAQFQKLGLKLPLKGKFRWGYLAVVDGKKKIFEKAEDAYLKEDLSVDGVDANLISAGLLKGNAASIKINGKEYSPKRRGLNFVVYDKKKQQVIDRVAFDTFDARQCFRP